MAETHFRPNKYKWVIVKNRRYHALRRDHEGYGGFQDIDQVEADARNVRKGIMGLGARLMDIVEIEDSDFKAFSQTISELRHTIVDNWNNGRQKTFVFVYYAGHGIMNNTTYAVCNEAVKRTKIRYPLEMNLRSLGTERGGYVMAIFDCCRERLQDAMRGGGDPPEDNLDMDMDDYVNYIFWFGCPPNSGVSASSTIAVDFFKQLKRVARPHDGSVVLPLDLMTWHPGDDGEMQQKYNHTLQLVHDEWEPQGPAPADVRVIATGEVGAADIDPDARKELKVQHRMNLRELYLQARNGSVMTQLGLKPVEDEAIRELKVSNMQVRTFQNMHKKYNSLTEYKLQVQRAREDHATKIRQYEEKREKLIREQQARIEEQKRREQEQRRIEAEERRVRQEEENRRQEEERQRKRKIQQDEDDDRRRRDQMRREDDERNRKEAQRREDEARKRREAEQAAAAKRANTRPTGGKTVVPNGDLAVSANKGVHAGEHAHFLLDDRQHAPEVFFKNSKGNFKSNGKGLEIYITVKGAPIWIAGYGIKSANDAPGRDPMKWDFYAKNDRGQETHLHSENGGNKKFPHRWQWWDANVSAPFAAKSFIIRFKQNHGDWFCCQMGQIRLHKVQ